MNLVPRNSSFESILGRLAAQKGLWSVVAIMVFTAIAAETCSGQILFRRRRERLKAEMKWELQQQLNANLNAQVDSARTDLADSASAQIQQEAAALRATLKSEIAAMRSEADKIVAEEKDRIAKQAAMEIAKIKQQASRSIEAAKKELQVTTMSSIAKAEDELKKALDNYSKVLGSQNQKSFTQFEKKTSDKFDSLKGEMVQLINKDVAGQVESAIKDRMAKTNRRMQQRLKKMIDQALAERAKQEKKPEPKEKDPTPEKKAVLNRVPRISEEMTEESDA